MRAPGLFLIIGAVSCAALACKMRQAGSALRDDASASPPPATELGASDFAILIPLAASPGDGDDIFGMPGSGYCNMPSFSDGNPDDPILSADLYKQFQKDVFRVVTPVPALTDTAVWKTPPTQADLNRNNPLTLPDSNECEVQPLTPKLKAGNDAAILATGTHVAALFRVQREACDMSKWRIVAVRFEPCPDLPDFYKAGAQSVADTAIQGYSQDQCGQPELRVTAQLFSSLANDGIVDVDMAMHLFFKLDSTDLALADLRNLAAVTKAKIAANQATLNGLKDSVKSFWQNPDPRVLTPHPGLHLEMDCSNPTQRGDVAQALFKLLADNANSSKLVKITWMTSNDGSRNRWTMGTRLVGGGHVTSDAAFPNENLSHVAYDAGIFPFSPFSSQLNNIGPWFPASAMPATPTADSFQMLSDLVNPLKVNFDQGGKKGGSCLSCHLHDQTASLAMTRLNKDAAGFAQMMRDQGVTDSFPAPATVWPPFQIALGLRTQDQIDNLRNFGYGPGLILGISQRAINEVEVARQFIARYLTPGGTDAATGTDTGTGTATTRTAWDVVDDKCTNCHGDDGRPPIFHSADGIQAFTAACRAEMYRRTSVIQLHKPHHMPPTLQLSTADMAIIHDWASPLPDPLPDPGAGPNPCDDQGVSSAAGPADGGDDPGAADDPAAQ